MNNKIDAEQEYKKVIKDMMSTSSSNAKTECCPNCEKPYYKHINDDIKSCLWCGTVKNGNRLIKGNGVVICGINDDVIACNMVTWDNLEYIINDMCDNIFKCSYKDLDICLLHTIKNDEHKFIDFRDVL